ncbi:MAG: hypothetical protein GX117_12215 [Candidatus Hydrogenedentes bacterium]|nr:hypothetical protein [Candidatus Hydrogenedentota bacterium]
MKKRLFWVAIAGVLMVSMMAVPAFADTDDPYVDPDAMSIITEGEDSATVEDVENYIDDKSSEIIHLLQYVGQPVLIIAFILFAFLAVFGTMGNTSLVGRGVLGMLICGVCYCLILYAGDIVVFISSWAKP